MKEVLGKNRPRRIGKCDRALLAGLEVAWLNRAIQFGKSLYGVPLGELGGSQRSVLVS